MSRGVSNMFQRSCNGQWIKTIVPSLVLPDIGCVTHLRQFVARIVTVVDVREPVNALPTQMSRNEKVECE